MVWVIIVIILFVLMIFYKKIEGNMTLNVEERAKYFNIANAQEKNKLQKYGVF